MEVGSSGRPKALEVLKTKLLHTFSRMCAVAKGQSSPPISDSTTSSMVSSYNYRLSNYCTCMQMSTNGLISFNDPFLSHIVMPFPRSSAPLLPLIAPLWSDFNFRETGTLYYRVTNDSTILNRISQEIEILNSDFTSYQPTQAVIVTWFQATSNQNDVDEVIIYVS